MLCARLGSGIPSSCSVAAALQEKMLIQGFIRGGGGGGGGGGGDGRLPLPPFEIPPFKSAQVLQKRWF